MLFRHFVAVAILSLVFVGAAGTAVGEEADWRRDRVEWHGAWATEESAHAPPTKLRIDNPWGDLRVRAAGDARLHLVAQVQHPPGDASTVELVPTLDGGVISIVPRFDDLPSEGPEPRVDLAVRVPSGLHLDLEVRDGLLEARGTAQPTTARSQHGEIRLTVRDCFSAWSATGPVLAVVHGVPRGCKARMTSEQGVIELRLPHELGAEIKASTRGRFTTDWSLEIEQTPGSLVKKARARRHSGGASFELESELGDIKTLFFGTAEGDATAATSPPSSSTPEDAP